MSERIYLSPPHQTGNEIKYIQEAFDTNWIAPLGPNVDRFENEMKEYLGGGFPVAMSSGTAAIHIALILLGIKPGDYVLCSSLTFVASANPIKYLGAIPVFVDSSQDDWNICPSSLKIAIENLKEKNIQPKALVAVDLLGSPANYDEIVPICNQFNIPIIEDSAEALGSSYGDIKCGLFGEFGVFSFNGNKILSTSGGGMLVCKTKEMAYQALKLITQAREPAPYYLHTTVGYNYRMSNIIAGLGIAQLQSLEDKVKRRREIFDRYQGELEKHEFIKFIPETKKQHSNRWLSSFLINPELTKINPEKIINALENENIEARRIWKPLHSQPLFENNDYFHSGTSNSDLIFDRGVSLPSGSQLTEDQQSKIIKIITEAI